MTIATGLRQRFSGVEPGGQGVIERRSGVAMPCVMTLAQSRQPG
jgi:hypothetical protein